MNNVKKMWMFLVVFLGVTMNANAGPVGTSEFKWKEEVLLHDGRKIIVTRSQTYGGHREVGQDPPIREHVLTFKLPGSGTSIRWVGEFSEDVGRANFDLVALHLLDDTPYVVAIPNLCLAYNKWGRPNPPYVLFKYQGLEWRRISIDLLPKEFTTVNVVKDVRREEEIERTGARLGYVPFSSVQELNKSLTRSELRSILREPIKLGTSVGSLVNCEELIYYKCGWISPHSEFGRKRMDRTCK